jgi:hypothetical protein
MAMQKTFKKTLTFAFQNVDSGHKDHIPILLHRIIVHFQDQTQAKPKKKKKKRK